jgi:spore maturation protein CgeB
MELSAASYVSMPWLGLPLRAGRKILQPLLIRDFNRALLRFAGEFKPHIFFTMKGTYVLPDTLKKMRAAGISLYNYYPDTTVFNHGVSSLARSLQEYDCVFSTKQFTQKDLGEAGYQLRHCEFLPHGYDPELHRKVEIMPEEKEIFGADAAFIGFYSPGKERTLIELKRHMPDLDLAIWGYEWNHSKAPELNDSIRMQPLLGDAYPKGLCASKIALALLIERQQEASSGDQITSRTFNIPATGTFMIHQRTDEVLQYYQEGREIECFSSVEELAEKIRVYLDHPQRRKTVAEAGYRRCVPSYSHDNRMKVILDWHQSRRKT